MNATGIPKHVEFQGQAFAFREIGFSDPSGLAEGSFRPRFWNLKGLTRISTCWIYLISPEFFFLGLDIRE